MGDVAKFLGEEPEGWGRNPRSPTRKKPGGRVGLRNPEKAGPRDDRKQKGNGREALNLKLCAGSHLGASRL